VEKDTPMEKKHVLVFTDNENIFLFLKELTSLNDYGAIFNFACSSNSPLLKYASSGIIEVVILKDLVNKIIDLYDLVISAHSKQIFPLKLVENVRCINIHPGFNPYTRGWFPQVFSIVKNLPLGVTVHEMDADLDHGPIIQRESIHVSITDTSYSVYCRLLEMEKRILADILKNLIDGDYTTFLIENEGNVFYKKDFNSLCEFNFDEKITFLDLYNRLRALTFDGYDNAFFINPENGKRVYISLNIREE
jgi:dTDP-4-amino-4,6-dideoxyglucose formyltransferase